MAAPTGCLCAKISIHALREEGDLGSAVLLHEPSDISIHALREEGDRNRGKHPEQVILFLSTPSARRATFFLTE